MKQKVAKEAFLLCGIHTALGTAQHCAATSCAALCGTAQRHVVLRSAARHCTELLTVCL